MLFLSGLPKSLWGEAVSHAFYLKNRSSTRILNGKTLYEVFYGVKPNLRGLPEFGAKVWVHTPEGSKLDGRSVIGQWVGFDEESSGYRIYAPEAQAISIQRSVKCESGDADFYVPRIVQLEGDKEKLPVEQPSKSSEQSHKDIGDLVGESFERLPDVEGRPKRVRQESVAIRRLGTGKGVISDLPRERGQLPKGVQEGTMEETADEVTYMAAVATIGPKIDEVEPSYEEARVRSDWPKWSDLIDVELQNLKAAGTWEVVERPDGVNMVDSKWVFRLKKDAKGNIIKWKARLVARGFTQIYGMDYFKTFAPVSSLASVRFILALAARNNWDVLMFDFHSAYLNGILDDGETIYMEQPPHHEEADRSRYIVKLQKSIYGLKQAGRKWYNTLCALLIKIGFQRLMADPAVFFACIGNNIVVLFIHVDDTTMTGSSILLINDFKQRIERHFDITDLGPISWLLGLAVTRNRAERTLSLSQESYINSLLHRFNLEDAKTLTTPMDSNIRLVSDDCPTSIEDKLEMKGIPYCEAIGALNWLAVGTRPDIAFIVGHLAQFLKNPGRTHWEAAKRVTRHLKGTKDLKLTYGGGERRGIEVYSDADGASQDHRRAISGFAVLIDGGAMSWSSKKQELITLSTMEAKYVAATHTAKELLWLQRLRSEDNT